MWPVIDLIHHFSLGIVGLMRFNYHAEYAGYRFFWHVDSMDVRANEKKRPSWILFEIHSPLSPVLNAQTSDTDKMY
ncbi:hypothetical protein CEXT_398221 [Caerostris extrusa]|uniref:Uncharacterized protein n=1 Tax=Caerostris extrusa TaxID=172846 RepID=A0AAV4NHA2_CAEEX|nr:hypothetical protein CEXT_398221 [Caerostris extrusa]